MILEINFKLEDIQDESSDSYELHLFFANKADRETALIEIRDKDFIFRLVSDWVVSAGYTKSWDVIFIKGCQNNALRKGNRHHYNKSINESFFENEFNNEIRDLFSEIQNTPHKGEFNTETRVMTINNQQV